LGGDFGSVFGKHEACSGWRVVLTEPPRFCLDTVDVGCSIEGRVLFGGVGKGEAFEVPI